MNFLIINLAFLFDIRVNPFSGINTNGIVVGIVFFLVLAASRRRRVFYGQKNGQNGNQNGDCRR